MKKVLKKLCFIAVLLSVFSACEEKPTEFEYSIYNSFENINAYGREVIIDMVNCIELDEKSIILNKREIGEMQYQDKKIFTVSSVVSSVYVIYRYREMNQSGTPHDMIYLKTNIYNLNENVSDIKLGYDNLISEDEFYNLINNN